MAELPSLDDDDSENDLYDDFDGVDLETNVFLNKETAIHEQAGPSNEKKTNFRVA